jgi:CHAT domain-containing protein
MLAMGGAAFDIASPVAPADQTRGGLETCMTLGSLRFAPLAATAREVTDVAALWTGEATVLTGARATERAFKERAPGSRVLHLATHGFFLPADCDVPNPGTRAVGGLAGGRQRPAVTPSALNAPLLLSGLALAGANRHAARNREDDGILTAEEVATLNLETVEWAVLSACDTGRGEIQDGEGVFGLRRAFQAAGVHTVIMSLWSVEDEATRMWMKSLYDARLRQGMDTANAVRQASLSMLQARRASGATTHPFYWAAFVAAGDWR